MKRTVSTLIILIAVLGLAMTVYAVADMITIDHIAGGAKAVPFNHKMHADAANDCGICHHENPAAPTACFGCHDNTDAANGGGHKNKDVMHSFCGKKCHTADNKGPTFPGNCPKCHTP
ncbi:MAG: cytochrome c3 family protein [Candidatus Alcyoniella australis]|nr:cytochrome c3 family protein [Candidatus Alcyoniella australis]